MKSSPTVVPEFEPGQRVVYPLQGVGLIQQIEDREFKGKQVPYYVIYLKKTDMTVMVPVTQSGESGIRALVSKEESERALALVGEAHEPIPSDWKLRYQMNLDLLKKGSIFDVATVVRALYFRSKTKELPILERKLFDSALDLLINEISSSIDKSQDEVEHLIFNNLESGNV